MRISWKKYTLQFKQPSGTSRGVLRTKDSWFLIYYDPQFEDPILGECSIIEGLSPDPLDRLETKLDEVCRLDIFDNEIELDEFPAILFAREMIRMEFGRRLENKPTDFYLGKKGLRINGLIWMGEVDFMKAQIREKVKSGFECIKLKIGAIDFESELALLSWIRKEYKSSELELRVDANGAFAPAVALEKLKRLSDFNLHSIEQPIAAKQWDEMAKLCAASPIDIALDEELIGLNPKQRRKMMDEIKPQYVILKPSFLGGTMEASAIIGMAEAQQIGWWLTSALESNVGLSYLAQYAAMKNVSMPQGLGTGGLYTNNVDSPIYLQGQFMHMHPAHNWNLKPLLS
jgi:o-succinylbenzoate synthase